MTKQGSKYGPGGFYPLLNSKSVKVAFLSICHLLHTMKVPICVATCGCDLVTSGFADAVTPIEQPGPRIKSSQAMICQELSPEQRLEGASLQWSHV